MLTIPFIKTHYKTILFAIGTVVLAIAFIWGFRALGSAINEHRINQLETEKQELLKQVQDAHDRELIIRGVIKAKDEQIKDLTERVSDSNQRVTAAHSETQTARANYEKVRTDPPKFNASDDAGRIREFSADVRGLYPDPPR